MNQQQWNDMKEIFCKQMDAEFDKYSKLPSLNDATLQNLWKLIDTKKNLLKIEKLEKELHGDMMDGYSMRGGYSRDYGSSYDNYGNSNRMMPGPIYGGSYDMGYSRNDSYSHLEAAMRDAKNDQEREEIRQIMMRYHN